MIFKAPQISLQTTSKIKSVGKFLINPSLFLLPKFIVSRADPERRLVDKFIHKIQNAPSKQLLLDAGAGNFRFKDLLVGKGYTYESQDFDQVFDQNSLGKHTYVCDIQKIPVETGRFDVIVCTQVLEHLADPLGAFEELSRTLKPGGQLYLTTNFIFPIHGAPYDYFRYTNFGLEYLCKKSDFTITEIAQRGGFFALCAKIIFDFPSIITFWLFHGGANPHGQRKIEIKSWPIVFLFTPAIFMLDIFCTLLAFLVEQLDSIDKKRRFTLGYQLHATRN